MTLKRVFNRMQLGDALDVRGLGGETYLTRAVKVGDVKMVQEFLDLGADPDVTNAQGELPLHIALVAQNFKIMHALLETGANIFLKQEGLTLSQHAEKLGMGKVSTVLRELEERKIAATIAATMSIPMGMGGIVVIPPSKEEVRKASEERRKEPKAKKDKNKKGPAL
jgi:ankyrin repeat protein